MLKKAVPAWKKFLFWTAGSIAVVLIILLLSIRFLIPEIISSEPAKEKIKAAISQVMEGTVDFQKVEVSLFPLPKTVIRDLRFSLPGKAEVSVDLLSVVPRILPLFTGKVGIERIQIHSPHLSLFLSEKEGEMKKSLSMEELKKRLSGILNAAASNARGIRIDLENGDIEISDGHGPFISLQNMALRILFSAGRTDLESSAHNITILRNGERIPMSGVGLSAGVVLSKDRDQITLNELKMQHPRLKLSGSIVFVEHPRSITLAVSGSHMDMASLRRAALGAAGDVAILRDIFDYVRGGEVPFVTVQSRGTSVEDLGRTENIVITSSIRGGDIFIPGPRLGFNGVNAECVISKGILEANNVIANIGRTEVRDCKVRVGLKGREVPLHVDAAFNADLAETRDMLRSTIKDEAFIKELERVRKVEGKATGRIVLGENTASLKPRIRLSEMYFSADHEQLPFPVRVKRGEFFYTDKGIGIHKIAGTLGSSSFKDLSSEFRLGDEMTMEISSADLRIEQDELFPWLKSLESVKGPLEKIRSVSGVTNVKVLHLSGPLERPGAWLFKLAGSVEDLAVDSVFSPEAVLLREAEFRADGEKLSIMNCRAEILDGSLVISGAHRGYAGGRPETELDFKGEMGPRFLEWAARVAALPSELSLREPLTFERAHIVLGEGTVLFEGKWGVREGPELAASIFRDSKELSIHDLTINDASSDAAISFGLRENTVKFGFAGKLSLETLNKMIASRKFGGGKIAGDFGAEIRHGEPLSFISRGKLRAEDISLLLEQNLPLTIENLSIGGDGRRILLEQTSLIFDGMPFSLRGTVESVPRGTIIDMDVSADRIEWEKMAETAGKIRREGENETDEKWDLPVEGSVRLNADYFSYGKYELMPVTADMALSRNAVDIATSSSICGISLKGKVGLEPGAISLDINLGAANRELEAALACFEVTDRDTLTGTFDLRMNLKAQGKKEELLDSLRGNMEFSARDGRIYNEVSLLKIFDFLKAAQILRGFPQMRQEGLAYKSIRVKGNLDAGLLDVKEVAMDGPSLKLAAQGSVDLKEEKMDFGVVVCPLKSSDFIIGKIPVVGGILGGNLVSIPVKVTGNLDAPKVSFNPVSAVGSGLLGIIRRTVEAPVKLFDPFAPEGKKN